MKKLGLILSVLILSTSPVQASHQAVFVGINGLVCDFCARSLEKVFGRQEAVEGVKVDLDTKVLTISLRHEKDIDDAAITKLITDAGYTVETIRHEIVESKDE